MEDIASMKVTDLKKELKSRGLTTTGNKTELIERLQLAMMSSSEATEESPEEDLLKDEEELLKEGSAGANPAAAATNAEADGTTKKKVAIKRDVELPVSTPEEKEKENIASGAPAPKKNLITSPEADKKAGSTTDAEGVKGEKEKSEVDGKADDSNGGVAADIEKAKARAERFGISTLSDTTKKLTRAERFGLPVGTPATGKEGDGDNKKSANKIGTAPSVDLDTLKKRAERFGNSSSNALKQAEIDEKIKKRQERFGVVEKVEKTGVKSKVVWNAGTNSVVLDEKLKKRAERFGAK